MDYGSLIYVALQRARTAREAIQVIVDLANEYGYASEARDILDSGQGRGLDNGPHRKGLRDEGRKEHPQGIRVGGHEDS